MDETRPGATEQDGSYGRFARRDEDATPRLRDRVDEALTHAVMIGLAVAVLGGIIGFLVWGRNSGAELPVDHAQLAADELRAGDCVLVPEDQPVLSRVELVPCEETHDARVFAAFEVADDVLGQQAIQSFGARGCHERRSAARALARRGEAWQASMLTSAPSGALADEDDRLVVCLMLLTDLGT
ncbi:hypothetical protein [Nocardioides stalactiti]|uniref:hypothetical protein n=1 Tax=Nocardioides stalactiti TaxID=2755356 RepID=UPI0016033D23|nr:hypothetical protein [Nocardioides stalactiti]